MKVIRLNKYKAFNEGLIRDYCAYMKKYSVIKETCLGTENATQPYKLINGAPVLVKVQHLYIYAEDILKVAYSFSDKVRIEKWLRELKEPVNVPAQTVSFIWSTK